MHQVYEYLIVLGVELDGREGGDLGVFQLVGGGVNFGDDDVAVLLEVLTEFVVDRHQLLAVAAPSATCRVYYNV